MPRPDRFAVAALCALGCAAPAPRILTGPGLPVDVSAWVAAHPIGPHEDVRAVPVARTPSTSHAIVQVRTRERPHAHESHDLTVHVVRGSGRMVLAAAPGGTVFVASIQPVAPGDSIVIGRGLIHWFENIGENPAVAFATFTPPYDGTDTATTPLMTALGEYLAAFPNRAALRVEGTIATREDGRIMALGRLVPEPRRPAR